MTQGQKPIQNVGWDNETHLIAAPHQMVPSIVCSSWDMAPQGTLETQWRDVVSTGDFEAPDGSSMLWTTNLQMWQSVYQEDSRCIAHNMGFDASVMLRYCQDVMGGHRPGRGDQAHELSLLIWEILEKSLDNEWTGRGPVLMSDTLFREKLLNLSTHGSLVIGPRGGKLLYSLADVVKKRYRVDLSAGKVQAGQDGRIYDAEGNDITGTPKAGAAWRLRYSELDGIPTTQWPMEAWTYAWEDAYWARAVWEAQEKLRDPRSTATHSTMRSESLQVYSAVALNLTTATGFQVDRAQVDRVTKSVRDHLDLIEEPLRHNGFLRANGSCNTKVVKECVENLWDLMGRAPLLTDGGDIATNKEVMEILCDFDPNLEIYGKRQKLAKLRDAFLPALTGHKIYVQFDPLKETGRTSSFGSREKKGRKPIYDAINGQQMPRQVGIRECFLPPPAPPGCFADEMLIASDDYEGLELCSVGQVTYNLFQRSVHRDKINAGMNLHSYLGSAIAMLKEPTIVGHASNLETAYQWLVHNLSYRAPMGYFDRGVKDSEVEDRLHLGKRSKHFRNFAKPVGLGYPGGLAERTMVVFAKTVYKVNMSEYEASELKELWLHIYPEMVDYFRWVRNARDMRNQDEHGDYKYGYITPGFGRFRAGATYCATSNGASMQSLSADGAKRSVCWTQRACCGGLPADNPFRILDQCLHLNFIHDENLLAIPNNPLATERAEALARLMELAMQPHMPDVTIRVEPALMKRWRKNAEPEWAEVAGDRERAYDLATHIYGRELGEQMMQQFSPANGRRMLTYEAVKGESIDAIAA